MSESRLEPGRLGPFVEGYRAWLLERGYSPGSVEHELRFLSVLGRWMVAEDLAVGQLDGDVIAAFVEAHRVKGRVAAVVARGSRSLLIYLRELGVVGPEPGDPLTPLGELIEAYRQWLVGDRGLAPLTVARYVTLATRFLGERVSVGGRAGREGSQRRARGGVPVARVRAAVGRFGEGEGRRAAVVVAVLVRARVDPRWRWETRSRRSPDGGTQGFHARSRLRMSSG